MQRLVVLALFGLLAQLVDGALGMAYGATSTSLLLVAGLAPATASASVHLAEMGTTLVAGTAHWRFGNVDWGIVVRIGVPGALGAFLGATALSSLSTAAARPVMAGILLAIGAWILVRFTIRPPAVATPAAHGLRTRFLGPLGLVAGFVDATGGGGWGPVATPSLLVTERVEPRRVIGTVDTAEFLVTTAASAGFLLGLGRSGFSGTAVVALLAGGLVAAPLAAWLVTRIPASMLGASVGGLLVLTNLHGLLAATALPRGVVLAADLVVLIAWAFAVTVSWRRHRRRRRRDDPDVSDDDPTPPPTGPDSQRVGVPAG
ncbi:sulfite exporter TauE/SafE family protein [Salsipaludibacter albus]|uniref:sulfite exporter TauE/SafE family protein n=1 Tax=Salsipaludibacter albus TaxID=2849650 RepID=UPI001EE4C8D5|nr:sulfite exporter TauE/SafE family protein [Salsipaludibacter albus]MBY5164407.1 sulfite exporter TauE/SafE family protein [Salsipaludibacter albus]